MPNIVMVGFIFDEEEEIQQKIGEILSFLQSEVKTEAVITTLRGSYCEEMVTGKEAPYLIVRDTSLDRGKAIAKALNVGLNVDVELETPEAFFPRE
jgi:hypothetical protein